MKSTVVLLFDVEIIGVNGDFDANVDCTSAKFNTLHTRNCSQSLNLVRGIMVWVVLTDWLAKYFNQRRGVQSKTFRLSYVRSGPSPAGGAVVPGPQFEIGVPPFHVWPTGCCIHPILYF